MTPSATTGSITLTCSADYFLTTMVGRVISLMGRQVTITSVTDARTATATVATTTSPSTTPSTPTPTSTAAPSGAPAVSALSEQQALWLERLARIHGLIDPLTVSDTERGDGTVQQTLDTSGGATLVTLQ